MRKKKKIRRIGWLVFWGLVALIVIYGYRAGWRIELTKVAQEPTVMSATHTEHEGQPMPENVSREGREGHAMPSPPPAAQTKKERKILYWVDPMHPAYKSDKPGIAPDCGMQLVPVYADEGEAEEEAKMSPGTITLTPQRQQISGVRTGLVEYRPAEKVIRTVGILKADETKIHHIHTKVPGWVERLYVDYTGQLIERGQPLVSIYSPELVSTQEEYLLALKARNYLGKSTFGEVSSGSKSLLEATRRRLLLWDISEAQIKALEESKEIKKNLILYSPMKGYVTSKGVFHGKYLTPEMELYIIEDLSTIWTYLEIYEYEMSLVKPGQEATVTLSYYPGEAFTGKVTYIYPYLDPQTRTNKVRVELPNPDYKLKPDMYANAELKIDLGRRLMVPEDAVLDSGGGQRVFLVKDKGRFQPQKVKLGLKANDYYEVLEGLAEGDRVVTSANFLIDSESRLKAAITSMEHQH